MEKCVRTLVVKVFGGGVVAPTETIAEMNGRMKRMMIVVSIQNECDTNVSSPKQNKKSVGFQQVRMLSSLLLLL